MYQNELVQYSQVSRQKYKNINAYGFFESIRWTLLFLRYCGMLPISGLRQADSRKSRIMWKTPYTVVYVIILGIQLFKVLIVVYNNLKSDFGNIAKLSSLFLSCAIFSSLLLLIPFCYNWNKMVAKIKTIEESLPPFSKNTARYMNILMVMMNLGSLVEHFLYQAAKYHAVILCQTIPGDSGFYIKSFTIYSFKLFYTIIPFSYYSSVIFQIAVVQTSLLWTFCDILIINISIYLTARFEYFNHFLAQKEIDIKQNKAVDPNFVWSELQQHYTRLMKLVHILDRNISPLVFLSCTNLIFIGKQVYVVLNSQLRDTLHLQGNCTMSDKLDVIKLNYYVFSASFLLLRVALVCILASRIHTLSRRPLEKLYTIPALAYDRYFQRLIDQVYRSYVALSGFRCFYITRQMILKMLATLLTYELMLLQNVH